MSTFLRHGGETTLPKTAVLTALRAHTRASRIATPTPPPMPEEDHPDCQVCRMTVQEPHDATDCAKTPGWIANG